MLPVTHWIMAQHILDTQALRHQSGINGLAFKIGSVLPDLLPNTVFARHCPDDSMPALLALDRSISFDTKSCLHPKRWFSSLRLGMICHYICDFFCRAHNETKLSRLGAHLDYEAGLNGILKAAGPLEILHNPDQRISAIISAHLVQGLDTALEQCHARYLAIYGGYEVDLHYSLNVAYSVMTIRLADLASTQQWADSRSIAA